MVGDEWFLTNWLAQIHTHLHLHCLLESEKERKREGVGYIENAHKCKTLRHYCEYWRLIEAIINIIPTTTHKEQTERCEIEIVYNICWKSGFMVNNETQTEAPYLWSHTQECCPTHCLSRKVPASSPWCASQSFCQQPQFIAAKTTWLSFIRPVKEHVRHVRKLCKGRAREQPRIYRYVSLLCWLAPRVFIGHWRGSANDWSYIASW